MCGVAGRFHPVVLPPDPHWHTKALNLLAHRGPDGQGHYIDNFCELIHRRLALIDLSPTGHQPMSNIDQSIYVIFNGEIYNHLYLRAHLEKKGYHFFGRSDTETLLYLYQEYGADMVEWLQGMFAFAIYDRRDRQLLLARDRFGIKPLYYAVHAGQWVFASEMKAILALQNFNPTLDRQACYDFIGLTYIPEPSTGFNEIRVLPKGHCLLVGIDGYLLKSYTHLKVQPDNELTLRKAKENASTTLLQAVNMQSVADVPVAALLSGGIDSSLVVAGYCQTSKKPPATFNVRFPDESYDETSMALSVAKHYGTEHKTINLSDDALSPDLLQKLLEHFDQPFADTSLIPTYWVSQAIRSQGIICAMSGDGGDEAFGGYGRFWRANKLMALMKMPHWLQESLKLMGQQGMHHTRDFGRQVMKAVQLAQQGKNASAVLLAGLSNYLNEEEKKFLVLPVARENLSGVTRFFETQETDLSETFDLEELSRRMTKNLFDVSLPYDMLRKVDMMSMLSSIEIRVPLLDEQVVGLGLTLPHSLKTDGQKGKMVLRALADEWLPKRVAKHPKHGFGIPLDRMLTREVFRMLEEYLLCPSSKIASFIHVEQVKTWVRLLHDAKQGRLSGSMSRGGLYQRVFMLLSLELWLRKYQLSW